MPHLTLDLPIKPTAKGRPRFGKGRTYTPKKTILFEQELIILTRKALPFGFKPILEPIGILIKFGMKRPKSAPRSRQIPICKPDIDNYLKAVMDGLNGIVWQDDALIWNVHATKHYCDKDSIFIEISY